MPSFVPVESLLETELYNLAIRRCGQVITLCREDPAQLKTADILWALEFLDLGNRLKERQIDDDLVDWHVAAALDLGKEVEKRNNGTAR